MSGRRGPRRDPRPPRHLLDRPQCPTCGASPDGYRAVVDDYEAMDIALREARGAGDWGDVPIGAVVTSGGRVIGAAGNEREASGDPTAHAEILALRRAAEAVGSWRLSEATLYVTLEPCPMCAGALVAARVGRLVFATPDPKAGACGSLYNLCCDPRLNHELPVTPGIRAEEAADLLSGWFASRRVGGGSPATG